MLSKEDWGHITTKKRLMIALQKPLAVFYAKRFTIPKHKHIAIALAVYLTSGGILISYSRHPFWYIISSWLIHKSKFTRFLGQKTELFASQHTSNFTCVHWKVPLYPTYYHESGWVITTNLCICQKKLIVCDISACPSKMYLFRQVCMSFWGSPEKTSPPFPLPIT